MKTYSKDHEWMSSEGDSITVGITDYAQDHLGDIVFVELPQVGEVFKKGEVVVVIESVKAASEVYAPCSLEVTEVNPSLESTPGLVNSHPEEGGWLVKGVCVEPAEGLMDEEAYKTFLKDIV